MKKLILLATALMIASGSGVYAREHHAHRHYSHARVHGFYGGAYGYGGGYGRMDDPTAEGRTSG